jgi:hypothetical protein
VIMGSLARDALRVALVATVLWALAAGIASGLHVSALLRSGLAKVLPNALDGACLSPLALLSLAPDSETAMLREPDMVGVAGGVLPSWWQGW